MSVGMFDGLRPLADALSGTGGAARGWYGVYVAVVTANQDDPKDQGRVKVALPWSPDGGAGTYETWARVATLMAGNGRGTWFVPDPEDEVLVAFEGGDPAKPVVLGSLWNGKDTPPEQMAAQNPKRTILTGAGVRITLDDTQGAVSLLLETPGGQRVRLDDTPATITIEDANANSVTMDGSGVSVVSPYEVSITTFAKVSVSAAILDVTAPISKVKVLHADSIITSSIASAAYLPGAGGLL